MGDNIICKVVSSMTAALRFDGELNVDMNEFQTNLVPFPRLHFMTTSLAPVISKTKSDREAHDCKRITDDCLQAISFRGDIKSQESNSVIQWVKQQGKVSFVEWCPT